MTSKQKIDAQGSARCNAAAAVITSKIGKLAKQASGIMARCYEIAVPELRGLSAAEIALTLTKVKKALADDGIAAGTLNVAFTVIGFYAKQGKNMPDSFTEARKGWEEAREAKREPRQPKGPIQTSEDDADAAMAAHPAVVNGGTARPEDANRRKLLSAINSHLARLSNDDLVTVALYLEMKGYSEAADDGDNASEDVAEALAA